jgi:tRNA (Thr-GGU) A37 N-methylase
MIERGHIDSLDNEPILDTKVYSHYVVLPDEVSGYQLKNISSYGLNSPLFVSHHWECQYRDNQKPPGVSGVRLF